MEKEKLQLLKEKLHEFSALHIDLKRAKNQKERKEITKELDWLKSKMIKDFNLMEHNIHVKHYSYDNEYFKGDVESIISNLKN